MIVLDTDHLSEYQQGGSKRAANLQGRMLASADREFVTTIITFEEQIRGRFASLKHHRKGIDEVTAYEQLASTVQFYRTWDLLPFDSASAVQYDQLKAQKLRVGARDLKIASIVLTRGAILLSANLRDFNRVPGLRVEDWLRN